MRLGVIGEVRPRAGARLREEEAVEGCTKQLILEHAQLLRVEAPSNVGRELVAEGRAQRAPGCLWGAGEELLVLRGKAGSGDSSVQLLTAKLPSSPSLPSPPGGELDPLLPGGWS